MEPGNILYYAAVTVDRRSQLRRFRALFHSWRVRAAHAGCARVIVWRVVYLPHWVALCRRSLVRQRLELVWWASHMLYRWYWWRWWRRYGSVSGGRLSTRRCGRYFR